MLNNNRSIGSITTLKITDANQLVRMFRDEGHINIFVNDTMRISIDVESRVLVHSSATSLYPITALKHASDMLAAVTLAVEIERLLSE